MSRQRDADAEFLVFAGVLALVGVAGIGSLVAVDKAALPWIEAIEMPGFAAPFWGYVLGWSCFYLAMAIAAWLVWREAGWAAVWPSFALWFAQLAILTGWTVTLFLLHRPGWALIGIAALFAATAASAMVFVRPSPLAALLMLGCLAWVGYAGLLNFAIWQAGT